MAKLRMFQCLECGGTDDSCIIIANDADVPDYCPWHGSKQVAWTLMIKRDDEP